MKTILFNVHDLALIALILGSLALAALCLMTAHFKLKARELLLVVFVLNACIALDTLVFWGSEVRHAAFDTAPWLLTVFSFSAFALGPVLYWFTRAETSAQTISWRDTLHLLPALATPFYLYWVCYQYPLQMQRELILDLGAYSLPKAYFATFITLKLASPLLYAVVSLNLIHRNAGAVEPGPSAKVSLIWVVGGFCAVRGWIVLTHVLGGIVPIQWSDCMGILSNYLALLLCVALWVVLGQRGYGARQAAQSPGSANRDHRRLAALAQQLQSVMEQDKPYLNSQMTLERFAELFEATPRQVSMAINRCFDQTYHEYVSRHRLEAAKQLLCDPGASHLSINDVALQSGFNSKATFNRLFKQSLDTTPSAFRERARTSLLTAEAT